MTFRAVLAGVGFAALLALTNLFCPLWTRAFWGNLLLLGGLRTLAWGALRAWERVERAEKLLAELREEKRVGDTRASPEEWAKLVQAMADLAKALTSLFQAFPELAGFLLGGWLVFLGLRVLGYLG
ncbi:hypothetical protein [Thermus thalpophilus]|uniref:hypothetical protein n=1 Tax=Thermus thalpophilus TaxID=2908147 RepID=UPI001FAA008B|nr:hypothetical protein [Thermus thalpophilus]